MSGTVKGCFSVSWTASTPSARSTPPRIGTAAPLAIPLLARRREARDDGRLAHHADVPHLRGLVERGRPDLFGRPAHRGSAVELVPLGEEDRRPGGPEHPGGVGHGELEELARGCSGERPLPEL